MDRGIGLFFVLAGLGVLAWLVMRQSTELHLHCDRGEGSCVLEEHDVFGAHTERFPVTELQEIAYVDHAVRSDDRQAIARVRVDLGVVHGTPPVVYTFAADPTDGDVFTRDVNEFLDRGGTAMFGPPNVLDTSASGRSPSIFTWLLALGALALGGYLVMQKRNAAPKT